MVNIKFIAKEAKVSLRTVSNVINNRDSQYSIETKNKVLDVIEKYQYFSNRIARGLRTGKSNVIGLVMPDISYHPIFSNIFNIINILLTSKGYNILVYNSMENLENEKKIITNLIESNVEGIILIKIVEKDPNITKIIDRGIPIVACLRSTDYKNIISVLTDNVKVGIVATEYLIRKGHRKIAHMVGNTELLAHEDRKKGYLQTLAKYNIEIKNKYLIYSDYNKLNLYEDLIEKFQKIGDFTAIFSYDDIVAANCVKAIKKIGKRVPEDVSIVCVNNSNFLNWLDPPLTTIEQPIKEICEKSVDLLLKIINSDKKIVEFKSKKIILEPRFIERESVADLNSV